MPIKLSKSVAKINNNKSKNKMVKYIQTLFTEIRFVNTILSNNRECSFCPSL